MASFKNYDDVVGQLVAAGLDPKLPLDIGTPKMVRCFMAEDRSKKRGAYRLYEMPLDNGDSIIVGSFGYSKGAEYFFEKVQVPKGDRQSFNADQLAAMKARQEADRKRAEAERKREAEAAAEKAGRWWRQCVEQGENAYLARKGLPAGRLYGARISKAGNLVVPLQDGDAKTWGLQVIYADPAIKAKKGRDKDFTPPGLAKKGHWHQIGSPMAGGIVLLCEGFATGASLHEATGLPVVVAFDAGSLLPVAQAVRRRYRGARILVCADDDYLTTPNTGVVAAQAAAVAIDGAYAVPVFPGERSQDKATKGPTDFNDLHVLPEGGVAEVRKQIESALASAGWSSGVPAARGGSPSRGAGSGDSGGRRVAVSSLPLDDIVERFIFIDDGTGDFIFDTWTREVCRRSKMLNMLPARVRGDDVKDHPRWKSRAVYIDQIGFDPAGDDANVVCNRWQGWPMKPVAGKCELLLETLRYYSSLEPNRDQVFRWMLCWLAYPLQHPGAKMQSAMVVHGPQGTGKSRFFEAYAKVFGDYSVILNAEALEDKFNSDWQERKLFIVADEVVARQEMFHVKNKLKNFITCEWIRVNPKNVAAHRERNHMNMVFLSNEKQPLVLENDDRRHLVLWTPPALSEAFYDDLSAEIADGGVEALYHYLLNLDLGDFKPWTKPPMTVAKQDLVALGLSSEERFIRDWREGDTRWPFVPCLSMDLYRAYKKYCEDHGISRPRESNHFLGHVAKLAGWVNKRFHCYEDRNELGKTEPRRMVVPAGLSCPEGKTQSGWLTECHRDFAEAFDAKWGGQ